MIEETLHTLIDPLTGFSWKDFAFKWQISADKALHIESPIPTKPLIEHFGPLLLEKLNGRPIYFNQAIKAHQTQLVGKGLRGIKNVIAIGSGKGGVGKSTLALNVAIALAKAGAAVGLLDCDIYGPSIPLMLGKLDSQVSLEDDKYQPITSYGLKAMSIGFLKTDGEALIWRGPMLAKALIHLIDFTNWGELDYLILDLPPGTGDIQLSLVQKIPLAGALVVTTPQHLATIDAKKAIDLFTKTNINRLGLVENMGLHRCTVCGHQEAIFGQGGALQLAFEANIPFLGTIPLDSQIQLQSDKGKPVALGSDALALDYLKIAMKLALSLSKNPLNHANKFPDIVVSS